jgi:hypothetical protein
VSRKIAETDDVAVEWEKNSVSGGRCKISFIDPRDFWVKVAERPVEWSCTCMGAYMIRTRILQVISQCAELGVFFAAAAALGAGVIFLR